MKPIDPALEERRDRRRITAMLVTALLVIWATALAVLAAIVAAIVG